MSDGDKYFIVSIDVEEDMPRWLPERVITTENIKALPRFQAMCDRFEVKPTYLVNYPVVKNHESLGILQNLSKTSSCEIGAHLHPWNTPPLTPGEELDARFFSQCSPKEAASKLRTLTQAIEDGFGVRPVSFRAGRFGLNQDVMRCLINEGYEVDSSVTPHCDWSPNGGPNFEHFPLEPFTFKDRDQHVLTEVPVTIAFDRKLPMIFERLYHQLPEKLRIKAILSHLKILRLIWLRPTLASEDEMKDLVFHLLKRGVTIFNMMFHSSELWPGTSPYFKTQLEVDFLFSKLEKMFLFFVGQMHCKSVTLSQIGPIPWGRSDRELLQKDLTLI